MALVETNRVSKSFALAGGSATSGAFTPSNNCLLTVLTVIQDNAASRPASDTTISDSLGTLTWTNRVNVTRTDGTSATLKLNVWTAPITTGASMTVTITDGHAGFGGFFAAIDHTGYNTGSPTGVTGTSATLPTDGAASLTLSGTPAATSATVALLGTGVGGTGLVPSTQGASWTELYDTGLSDFTNFAVETLIGLGSTTVPWADIDTSGLGCYLPCAVALEIVASAAQDPDVPLLRPSPSLTLPAYRM